MSVVTEQVLSELRERNEKRLEEAKKKLGEKYLLHPKNLIRRKTDPLFRGFQSA